MTTTPRQLACWLQPRTIVLDADVRDRQHAIKMAAAELESSQGIDATSVHRTLWRREQLESTAIGHGLAIPHAQIEGIDEPVTLFMRTRHPIPFKAPDGHPVSNILTILVPASGARQDHLQLLALVAQLFSDPAFRAQLARAPTVAAAEDAFRTGIARIAQP